MKLTDIKGERAMDVAAELITPIINIASDESAADLFRRRKLPDNMSLKEFALTRLNAGLPILLKNHKDDVVTILSLIKGETKEEIMENMTVISLVNDISDMMTDDLLRVFFSFAQMKETSSESVQKNTEEKT